MAWWNELPVVGGLAGAIFGNPEQEAQQRAMQQASAAMMRYRPDAMNARMNAFGSMQHAFDPMNNLMGQMYGPAAQMNMQQTMQNPFPKAMQSSMVDQAFKPEMNPGQRDFYNKAPPAVRAKIDQHLKSVESGNRQKAGY